MIDLCFHKYFNRKEIKNTNSYWSPKITKKLNLSWVTTIYQLKISMRSEKRHFTCYILSTY